MLNTTDKTAKVNSKYLSILRVINYNKYTYVTTILLIAKYKCANYYYLTYYMHCSFFVLD